MTEAISVSLNGLEQVRQMLLQPSAANLNLCMPIIRETIDSLTEVRARMGAGTAVPAETRLRIEQTARVTRQISLLLHHAGGLQLGWARMFLAAAEAYRPDGGESPLPDAARLPVAERVDVKG